MNQSINQSICLSFYLPFCPSTNQSVYSCFYVFIYLLGMDIFTYAFIHIYIYIDICLFIWLLIYMSRST